MSRRWRRSSGQGIRRTSAGAGATFAAVPASKFAGAALAYRRKFARFAKQESFEPEMVVGHRLVIAATDDAGLNRLVTASANRFGVLVNVVDDPALCGSSCRRSWVDPL